MKTPQTNESIPEKINKISTFLLFLTIKKNIFMFLTSTKQILLTNIYSLWEKTLREMKWRLEENRASYEL